MATSSSYYLNAPSLGSATAVFTDEALSTCAPDGFYSNGSIVREQVGCVLLPQQTCPTCATPCGETINASGGQGIYLLDLDTGSTGGDVGAVIVRFDPYSVPDGIRATLGANVYNALTSSVDGFHQSATAGNFTYIGQIGGDCGISGTTYPALTEYSYNGTSFVATGGTQSITVAPGDVSLGASSPGSCLMVIPKLTASPSVINFEVVGPCSGTAWQMSVDCPVLLTGFSSSVMAATSSAACELTETVTYYNASLANTPGTVGLYDFVFADAYGSTPLPTGCYKATGSITGGNDWFQVGSDGIVIMLGTCTAPPVVSYNCVEGTCTDPGDGTGTYSTLEACESACSAPVAYTIDNSATGTSSEACGGSTTTSTVYALPGYTAPMVGMILYDSTSLTTPFIGSTGWRKLSIGGTNYAAEVNTSGEVTNYITCAVESYNCVEGVCTDPGDGTGTYSTLGACEAACSAPTTVRIDWNVGAQSGGQLIIFNDTMTELLNVTSAAGGAQSGTIYPLVSELPYTIRGQWASGSGNVIQYNVCDMTDGGTIFSSGVIDVTTSFEDYTPSPTPVYTLVQLRANNVTPPSCPVV